MSRARRWKPCVKSCEELFTRDVAEIRSIISFSQELDNLLGGGIQLGTITECAGPSGIGKTQLCLQLAIDVQIPQLLAGVEGEAVYIDTEGGLSVKRLTQIAAAAVAHCKGIASTDDEKSAVQNFTVQTILSRVHCFRALDMQSLQQCVHTLTEFLKVHPEVKLVIVDSIAMHFRGEFTEMFERFHAINTLTLALLRVALNFDVAVVISNQMTTRFTHTGVGYCAPSLGYRLSSNCSQQLLFTGRQENLRKVTLMKSSSQASGSVLICITESGIRDVSERS